jgi:hypothetical protein
MSWSSPALSGATSTKKRAFAVGKVNEAQLQEVPGGSALEALTGKVSGVRVVGASGAPGGAPNLKLRGATSIGGRQDPLIIIDGVIIRSGIEASGAATLADISGEDIERVEVVRARRRVAYGSDARPASSRSSSQAPPTRRRGSRSSRGRGGVSNQPTFIESSGARLPVNRMAATPECESGAGSETDGVATILPDLPEPSGSDRDRPVHNAYF